MFSILLPVFNFPVTALVRSLKKQAEKEAIEYEIIIADDASTDKTTLTENKKIADFPGCTFIRFKKNRGRTATRHFLAEQATSDRVLFLDADVMPLTPYFLRDMLRIEQPNALIFGGITYEDKKPIPEKMLRWKYGRIREDRSLKERRQAPYYSVISGAMALPKSLFLKLNSFRSDRYGVDILFIQHLKAEGVPIIHIDNPVIHLGLESNEAFLKKTIKGLDTLVYFESKKLIPDDYRPVQKAYKRLKKRGLTHVFRTGVHVFKTAIKRNLCSRNPSLFLFDIYKLYYFSRLKKESDDA